MSKKKKHQSSAKKPSKTTSSDNESFLWRYKTPIITGLVLPLAVILVAWISDLVYKEIVRETTSPLSVSLQVGQSDDSGMCATFAILDGRSPSNVPVPDPQTSDTRAVQRAWVERTKAVDLGGSSVEVRIQGIQDGAVVLNAMRLVRDSASSASVETAYEYRDGCGGAFVKRSFSADLDQEKPSLTPNPIMRNDEEVPGDNFPLKVDKTDPETIVVIARATMSDVKWHLELDWYSSGRSGTISIGHDAGLRTLGSAKVVTTYSWMYSANHQWEAKK